MARAELARVSRVMTMGELTASIAHEVNQPLGAMVANAAACARWLVAEPPEIAKTRKALNSIAADGNRRTLRSEGRPFAEVKMIIHTCHQVRCLRSNLSTREQFRIFLDGFRARRPCIMTAVSGAYRIIIVKSDFNRCRIAFSRLVNPGIFSGRCTVNRWIALYYVSNGMPSLERQVFRPPYCIFYQVQRFRSCVIRIRESLRRIIPCYHIAGYFPIIWCYCPINRYRWRIGLFSSLETRFRKTIFFRHPRNQLCHLETHSRRISTCGNICLRRIRTIRFFHTDGEHAFKHHNFNSLTRSNIPQSHSIRCINRLLFPIGRNHRLCTSVHVAYEEMYVISLPRLFSSQTKIVPSGRPCAQYRICTVARRCAPQ